MMPAWTPHTYAPAMAAVVARVDQLGVSRAELARRTGIDRARVSRLLAGQHRPYLDEAQRLAGAVGLAIRAGGPASESPAGGG
jgi:Predicted transcriptional regulators